MTYNKINNSINHIYQLKKKLYLLRAEKDKLQEEGLV